MKNIVLIVIIVLIILILLYNYSDNEHFVGNFPTSPSTQITPLISSPLTPSTPLPSHSQYSNKYMELKNNTKFNYSVLDPLYDTMKLNHKIRKELNITLFLVGQHLNDDPSILETLKKNNNKLASNLLIPHK
jgi:hypothetical protein